MLNNWALAPYNNYYNNYIECTIPYAETGIFAKTETSHYKDSTPSACSDHQCGNCFCTDIMHTKLSFV